jgi:hypothetical protein
MAINNFNVGVGTTSQLTRYRYVATGGETSVSGTDADGKTLSYTVGLEQVFLNGVNLVRGQDYTATNGTSVGALSALVASDVVEVFAFVPFNIANALTVSTVDAKGDLLVGTGADTVGRLAVGTDGRTLIANSGQTSGLQWITGGILQVVSTTKTDTFTTSSASFVDVTGLSASITPLFSTSKILVLANFVIGSSPDRDIKVNLVRGSTNIAQSTGGTVHNETTMAYPFNIYAFNDTTINFLDSPATTSSTTYKIQMATSGATAAVGRRGTDAAYGAISTITLMEVSA